MRTFSTHLAASSAASGLKWMSATIGTWQPRGAQLGDDVLEVGRVLHRRRGDAHDLAADRHQVERLLDARRGVHRVAGDHGLHHHGMVAADDDAAAGRVADHHFAGRRGAGGR